MPANNTKTICNFVNNWLNEWHEISFTEYLDVIILFTKIKRKLLEIVCVKYKKQFTFIYQIKIKPGV